jgi:hypothetical protein
MATKKAPAKKTPAKKPLSKSAPAKPTKPKSVPKTSDGGAGSGKGGADISR